MKTILFLHGFFASGSCIPALALREAMKDKANVLSPDLSIHPSEAMETIRTICSNSKIDLLVGNSCGSFYAQMIAQEKQIPALLGNPHLQMTEFLKTLIGNHDFKAPREDGNQQFTIDEQLIAEFDEMQKHQFEGYNPDFATKVWAIFGQQDTLAHFEPLYLRYYSDAHHFPGGHTPTAEEVKTWYVPLAKQMLEVFTKEEKMSDYERYCQMMAQQQEEDMDDVCFDELPEGQFVRGH